MAVWVYVCVYVYMHMCVCVCVGVPTCAHKVLCAVQIRCKVTKCSPLCVNVFASMYKSIKYFATVHSIMYEPVSGHV